MYVCLSVCMSVPPATEMHVTQRKVCLSVCMSVPPATERFHVTAQSINIVSVCLSVHAGSEAVSSMQANWPVCVSNSQPHRPSGLIVAQIIPANG